MLQGCKVMLQGCKVMLQGCKVMLQVCNSCCKSAIHVASLQGHVARCKNDFATSISEHNPIKHKSPQNVSSLPYFCKTIKNQVD